MSQAVYEEPSQRIPILVTSDVVVCGGGPAGVAAAIASARGGARTVLLENQGCLGGIWTSGLLSWIIDAGNKKGIMREIVARLDRRHARIASAGEDFTYDPEEMKLLLEEMCEEAGVTVMLHTRVVHAAVEESGRLTLAITESKSGRQAWAASMFIDATGDGDLAARAGCRFDLGRPRSGETQPMSLMALVAGIDPDEVAAYTMDGVNETPKARLLERMEQAGQTPSYAAPSLFHIRDGLFALMANHEYGASALQTSQVTQATLHARKELHRIIVGLRTLGGAWANIRIVSTANHIGVREGRRIHGRYTVSEQDLQAGARHEDGICRVRYGIDIHSTNPDEGKGFGDDGKRSLPYDIPLRALIAADVDGLLMAGRCISGDFIAHSSYRVTGNAVAMGQAAGAAAAIAAITNVLPQHLNGADLAQALQRLEEAN
ncbi:FAD-dependent oxidoreductase [Cohnella sp. GCM10027633]|uniref:FAD-dependent oxidoreductase n=1 Tax=unclassified Cohnella TaxID=2636738 RepID=UPI00363D3F4A